MVSNIVLLAAWDSQGRFEQRLHQGTHGRGQRVCLRCNHAKEKRNIDVERAHGTGRTDTSTRMKVGVDAAVGEQMRDAAHLQATDVREVATDEDTYSAAS